MPIDLKGYRVFIASPGGLDAERRAFREAVQQHCENDGFARKVIFIPVGWEETLGGKRRPQSAINDEIDTCDYFVLLLWDRWGTPPDATGTYTSGTEEEFHCATKLIADPAKPMREMVVFFKAVEPKQLSDPGDQLKKVLAFRKKLEETKEHFFHTFDDTRRLEELLNRFLHQWVRDHEAGQAGKATPPEARGDVLAPAKDSAPPSAPPATGDIAKLLDDAEALADQGKLTDAEALFSRAVIRSHDANVLIRYGQFVQRLGRMAQAQEMFDQALNIARQNRDRLGEGNAALNLGHVALDTAQRDIALKHYEESLSISHELGDRLLEAKAHGNLGLAHAASGDLGKAIEHYEQALPIARGIGERTEEARILRNLGALHIDRGEAKKAIELLEDSLKIAREMGSSVDLGTTYGVLGHAYLKTDVLRARNCFNEYLKHAHEKDPLGETKALQGIGITHLNQEEASEAIGYFQRSLALARQRGDRRREGNALGNLGNAYLQVNDFRKALEFYSEQMKITQEIGDRRGHAHALFNSARILMHLGKQALATTRAEEALKTFSDIESPFAARVSTQLAEWRAAK